MWMALQTWCGCPIAIACGSFFISSCDTIDHRNKWNVVHSYRIIIMFIRTGLSAGPAKMIVDSIGERERAAILICECIDSADDNYSICAAIQMTCLLPRYLKGIQMTFINMQKMHLWIAACCCCCCGYSTCLFSFMVFFSSGIQFLSLARTRDSSKTIWNSRSIYMLIVNRQPLPYSTES